jgi:hypothetical protein
LLVNRAKFAVSENAAINPDFVDVSQMGVYVLNTCPCPISSQLAGYQGC